MKELVRGTDLIGLPVVTLGGDDIGEVRDVVFDRVAGRVVAFTLNKRGRLFGGRLHGQLRADQVHAVGPAAVMVPTDATISDDDVVPSGAGGDVLGDDVITDSGVRVGTVTDVVVDTASGRVAGYEVRAVDEPDTRHGRRSYVPLAESGAVSGEALVVPAATVDYVAGDLAGFGEAVDRFRARLREGP